MIFCGCTVLPGPQLNCRLMNTSQGFLGCEGKGYKGTLTWVGAVNEVLGDSAYDISSSARNMTLLNDALNKCIEQAGCMAR